MCLASVEGWAPSELWALDAGDFEAWLDVSAQTKPHAWKRR